MAEPPPLTGLDDGAGDSAMLRYDAGCVPTSRREYLSHVPPRLPACRSERLSDGSLGTGRADSPTRSTATGRPGETQAPGRTAEPHQGHAAATSRANGRQYPGWCTGEAVAHRNRGRPQPCALGLGAQRRCAVRPADGTGLPQSDLAQVRPEPWLATSSGRRPSRGGSP